MYNSVIYKKSHYCNTCVLGMVEENSDERQNTLFMRLTEESDKIRKWKVNTESQLHEKVIIIKLIFYNLISRYLYLN